MSGIDRLPTENDVPDKEFGDTAALESMIAAVGGLGGLSQEQSGFVISGPKRGRPKLDSELDSIDCYRAWYIHGIVKMLRLAGRTVPKQSDIIKQVKELDEKGLAPDDPQVFRRASLPTLQQSVSRGKAKLKIARDWTGGSLDHDLPPPR